MTTMANKRIHTNRRSAFQFRCSESFGRWIRRQRPFPAAVGDPYRYAISLGIILKSR
jgi:hypothetical protein